MAIDELGLVDPAIVGEALYMIANGHGKSRMGQAKRRWRVLFLTSGEVSLAEHKAEVGKETKKGQEVRLLDIAADAGGGMGLFENVHSFNTPAEFANYLKTVTRQHHGTPIQKFLSLVTASKGEIESEARSIMDAFTKLVTPNNVSGEVPRAIRRFAIVAAAGEIATLRKLTGWKPGESIAAAERCFHAWMEHRRSFDPVAKAVNRVRTFISENENRFEVVGGEVLLNKVGYKKKSLFLICPEVFRDVVCAGAKPESVAEGLECAGFLNMSGRNRLQKQERIGGKLMYFYSVSESILQAA
jgi:putative DNA primase/helicase